MTQPMPGPPDGWYPDNQNPAIERWWQNGAWTDACRPRASAGQVAPIHQAMLSHAVMAKVAEGYRLESQAANQAVLIRPAKVNHAVHAILSLFTFGLWLIIWLIVALGSRDARIMLTIDELGNIHEQPLF